MLKRLNYDSSLIKNEEFLFMGFDSEESKDDLKSEIINILKN